MGDDGAALRPVCRCDGHIEQNGCAGYGFHRGHGHSYHAGAGVCVAAGVRAGPAGAALAAFSTDVPVSGAVRAVHGRVVAVLLPCAQAGHGKSGHARRQELHGADDAPGLASFGRTDHLAQGRGHGGDYGGHAPDLFDY